MQNVGPLDLHIKFLSVLSDFQFRRHKVDNLKLHRFDFYYLIL